MLHFPLYLRNRLSKTGSAYFVLYFGCPREIAFSSDNYTSYIRCLYIYFEFIEQVYLIPDCVLLADYAGKLATTKKGYECQKWDMDFPHEHSFHSNENFPADGSETNAENFCRAAGQDYLWCYTTDPDKRWDTCVMPDEIC